MILLNKHNSYQAKRQDNNGFLSMCVFPDREMMMMMTMMMMMISHICLSVKTTRVRLSVNSHHGNGEYIWRHCCSFLEHSEYLY